MGLGLYFYALGPGLAQPSQDVILLHQHPSSASADIGMPQTHPLTGGKKTRSPSASKTLP